MRRPIFLVLFGFAGGILVKYYIDIHMLLFCICLTVALIALVTFLNDKTQSFLVMLVGVSFFMGAIGFSLAERNTWNSDVPVGIRSEVKGTVLSISKKDEDYFKAIVRLNKGEKLLVNITGKLENYIDLSGRTIMINGIIEEPSPRRNPKTFDYALYLKSCGIEKILKAKAYDLIITEEKTKTILNKLAKMKYNLIERIKRIISPEKSGILIGMLFGDKSYMDDDIYAAFQKNGIAHILSVSGIHVAIIYACIAKVLGNRRRIEFSIITFALLVFYAALAEFSPSVVRAVSMITLHLISKLIYCKYDLASATATCAIGMLFINPYDLLNVGFQLSFLAVFTLAVALPWTLRQLDFLQEAGFPAILNQIFKYVAPLLVIQTGMALFTAYIFNYFSLGAFFLNIPIIFIAGLIIPIGVIMIILSIILDFICSLGVEQTIIYDVINQIFNSSSFVQSALINCMETLNTMFYRPGISFFSIVSPKEWIVCLHYILMFFLLSEYFRILYQRKKKKKIYCLIATALLVSIIIPNIFLDNYSDGKLVFVDVAQGDSLHIRTPKGKNILIDGGGNLQYNVGEKTLQPYLLKNGIKEIDLAIVSHLHDDHYLGLAQLGKVMNIKKFATYEANILKSNEITEATGVLPENIIYLYKGQTLEVEEGIKIEILYPEQKDMENYKEIIAENKDENLSSLIIKVTYQDISVLMTGDMGVEGEKTLIEMYKSTKTLNTNVLKVGHHGSKYSTCDSFIEAVQPNLAVFQVGKNNFGHPNEAVIEKFSNSGIMVLRNDLHGAVIFSKTYNLWEKLTGWFKSTDRNGKWHIKTMIK